MMRRPSPLSPLPAGPLRSRRPSALALLRRHVGVGRQLPGDAAAARHGAAGRAGRRAAVGAGPNAPDSYTVKSRRHAVGHLQLFLKSPWRWPELWGMNLDQIRNPHLIYPGQILVLDKTGGRRGALASGRRAPRRQAVKLSPRVRSTGLGDGAIAASIPCT